MKNPAKKTPAAPPAAAIATTAPVKADQEPHALFLRLLDLGDHAVMFEGQIFDARRRLDAIGYV
jgi:hypothetical protein